MFGICGERAKKNGRNNVFFFCDGEETTGMHLKFTIVRLDLREENVSLRRIVVGVVNASLL